MSHVQSVRQTETPNVVLGIMAGRLFPVCLQYTPFVVFYKDSNFEMSNRSKNPRRRPPRLFNLEGPTPKGTVAHLHNACSVFIDLLEYKDSAKGYHVVACHTQSTWLARERALPRTIPISHCCFSAAERTFKPKNIPASEAPTTKWNWLATMGNRAKLRT